MSGVWVFDKNGVIRLVENPGAESEGRNGGGGGGRKKVLVHLPSGQVISSYSSLEHVLKELGWERYYGGDPDLFQFHKHSSIDLISLPRDFSKFNSVYMYDIVIKNPNIFHVRDEAVASELAWASGELIDDTTYYLKLSQSTNLQLHCTRKVFPDDSNQSTALQLQYGKI